ncbi:hypothetical protein EVAR_15771_1 [Eumeta japonica]|uniref:Uncharacterized protein n=1 Tax=Eumeta variegata TaxID=151549 RepID=A0A4C1TZC0_EUMVA|nr:hypothetical protein EVAR_15771_1 [Eumeta japonica]
MPNRLGIHPELKSLVVPSKTTKMKTRIHNFAANPMALNKNTYYVFGGKTSTDAQSCSIPRWPPGVKISRIRVSSSLFHPFDLPLCEVSRIGVGGMNLSMEGSLEDYPRAGRLVKDSTLEIVGVVNCKSGKRWLEKLTYLLYTYIRDGKFLSTQSSIATFLRQN